MGGAIEAAIQLEKDIILLYLSMNKVIENVGEKGIDRIIDRSIKE